MSKTVSDFFWDRLHQWGVRRVFGYPGDGVNGLLGALNRFGTDKTDFVQVRQEGWWRSWCPPTRSSPASWASASLRQALARCM